MMLFVNLPNFVRKILKSFLRVCKQTRHASIIDAFCATNIDDIKQLAFKRSRHLDLMQELWKKQELDALIIPTHPLPAFQANIADDIGLMPCGARLGMYWQFCAGYLPITVVKEDEQHFEEKVHNDMFTKVGNSALQGSKGMPVGVEICCLPFRDEKAIRIMNLVEKEARFHSEHPYPDVK